MNECVAFPPVFFDSRSLWADTPFSMQEIDESRVAIDAYDEKFVALRRSLYELQRSLKSAAINNNVLLKHLESSIQNKAHNTLLPSKNSDPL